MCGHYCDQSCAVLIHKSSSSNILYLWMIFQLCFAGIAVSAADITSALPSSSHFKGRGCGWQPSLQLDGYEDESSQVLSGSAEDKLLQAKSRPDRGISSTLKFGTVVSLRLSSAHIARRVRAKIEQRRLNSAAAAAAQPATDDTASPDISQSQLSQPPSFQDLHLETVGEDSPSPDSEPAPAWLASIASAPKTELRDAPAGYQRSTRKFEYQMSFSKRGLSFSSKAT